LIRCRPAWRWACWSCWRADIQKKLASLQARIQKYAVVQEGERPAEDPQAILRQIEAVADELQRLVFAINRTNLHHKIKTGESLTQALARRDSLVSRHRILQSVIDVCSKPPERYGVTEIRWVTTVDVAQIQGHVDDLAKQIRELNAAIQEAGWQVELEQ
jgi:DNA-binding FrmR family transcriptional regulator